MPTSIVEFPVDGEPLVSVLMVLFRGGAMALDALRSVAAHTDVRYEIVIVDNASPDASGSLVRLSTRHARWITSTSNLGFGPAMNLAAGQARGRFLCLLNPDTLVQPGWIKPLLARLEWPGAVAATPVLWNLDGSIQEAGGVVDGHGFTHAIGTGDWAFDDLARTARVVDYASAAALVVTAESFRGVEGFDERYRLAYFEDVDLAFSLARAGGQTWLEPTSRVIHRRGGTDVGRTALDLASENHARFVDKWGLELAGRPTDIGTPQTRRHLCEQWPKMRLGPSGD